MKTRMRASFGLLLAASVYATSPIHAEEFDRPAEAGALHSVWVYKLLCYDTMPDKVRVEKMAGEFGFKEITGAALKAFAPQAPATYLKAWELNDHERVFKTAVSVASVDEPTAGSFPDFAKGTSTGCTVILPAKDDPKEIAASMQKLIERAPDESYPAGPFQVSSWSGQTENNVFLVYHYAPSSGKPGGLLSLVTLSK